MSLLQVVVLGVIQGFTEFLPISSTAHLYLTSWLLGWKAEALDFDIALHVGTLLAVLLYFSRDWIQIVVQGFGGKSGHDSQLSQNRGLLWLLAIGSLPVGAAGLAFNKEAEGPWRNAYVMGTTLIAVGIFMWLAERGARKGRDLGKVHLWDAVAIGIAQAFAVIPGVSRSGVTISEGLFRNLDRESSARFSFLLSTPAIAAAAGKALYDFHKNGGLHAIFNANFAVGVAASTVSGCAVIAWFLRYLRRSSLRPFVYYRIVFGIIVLALAFIRRPA